MSRSKSPDEEMRDTWRFFDVDAGGDSTSVDACLMMRAEQRNEFDLINWICTVDVLTPTVQVPSIRTS